MIPTILEAQKLLEEANGRNSGPWSDHGRVAAACARKIAEKSGMDGDKAYVLGLLHDIGRRYGRGHLRHVYDGWKYTTELGYDEVARICLTHSFSVQDMDTYIGNNDLTDAEYQEVKAALMALTYDDYDRLIQLCDSIAMAEGVADIEVRMGDVKRRYGGYNQKKWDQNLALKAYFEAKMGCDLYTVTGKDF